MKLNYILLLGILISCSLLTSSCGTTDADENDSENFNGTWEQILPIDEGYLYIDFPTWDIYSERYSGCYILWEGVLEKKEGDTYELNYPSRDITLTKTLSVVDGVLVTSHARYRRTDIDLNELPLCD